MTEAAIRQQLAEIEEQKRQLEQQRSQIAREHQRMVEESATITNTRAQLREATVYLSELRQNMASTTMGQIGQLKEFDMKEDFELWIERFEQFVIINNVIEVKQKSLFLTLIGTQAYSLLRNLCAPVLPSGKTLSELRTVLKGHLQPAQSVITVRYKFKECRQEDNQSIKQYLANLKQISILCEFGDNLESSLRDQFVWGLKSAAIKKRLLGEAGLTYQRAVELATALESAAIDVVQIGGSTSDKGQPFHNIRTYPKSKTWNQGRNGSDLSTTCSCCGRRNHQTKDCRYKRFRCNICNRQGHLATMCHNKSSNRNQNCNVSKGRACKNNDDDDQGKIVESNVAKTAPILIKLKVENVMLNFEVDTGSAISAISEKIYTEAEILKRLNLLPTKRYFKSYQGDIMVPLGLLIVNVEYNNISFKNFEMFVFKGNSTPIVGREWVRNLGLFKLNFGEQSDHGINYCQDTKFAIDEVMHEYSDVFTDKLGRYTKKKFKLELKENVTPVFCKPRPIPYALLPRVDKEIDRLVKDEILFPVDDSDWGTPIVPIVKKDSGDIRLCGDFKITLNPNLKKNKHPIPRVQDLLVRIKEGQFFSKIDLSRAYQQVELDDESKKLVVISTHRGLFAYNRLCFGVSPAPGLFQEEMGKILKGIEGVVCFYDDILIAGQTRDTHDERLQEVLNRLRDCGLTAQKKKCELFKTEVQFLGYVINKEGIHISERRIKAILEIPVPSNQKQLRAFLGVINFYAKFIKNYSEIVSPLYELLQKNVQWSWTKTRNDAFSKAKKCLISHNVLVHFDTNLKVKLTCDASPTGIGAVLAHVFDNDEIKPIAFASRMLTKAERNYSQIDREALAIVFAVKTFHQFLYGIDNISADFLSRMNSQIKEEGNEDSEEFTYLNYILDDIPTIDDQIVSEESERDAVLSKVISFVKFGWPKETSSEFKSFENRRRELTIENKCLMWGHRVVIPCTLRSRMLNELHEIDMGIVRIKSLARSYIWWPGIDRDIEEISKSCVLCLENADYPPRARLHPWSWPDAPNQRLHGDFLGPIDSQMYIVILDAFSKWLDVRPMSDITSKQTILVLKDYFTTWGLPVKLVTDNGPAFTSKEFMEFLVKYGVMHIRTAPYHPASNGAAENSVKTFKKKFKILVKSGLDKQEALFKFLFYYRATQHSTTGYSPAELQTGRAFRTRLDLLRPTLRNKVQVSQEAQQRNFCGIRCVQFEVNEKVMVKDYSSSSWILATVTSKLSPVTYQVIASNGIVWKRHVDQIKKCTQEIRPVVQNVEIKEHQPGRLGNDNTVMPSVTRDKNVIVDKVIQEVEIETENHPKLVNNSNESCVINDKFSCKEIPNVLENKLINATKCERAIMSKKRNPIMHKNVMTIPTLRRSSRTTKPPQRLDL
ncbi:uncharacterized protein K02A2.6-like [Diprion similis]|uniref:uncharacterized protein K02A2.6-like n=1 Tax=Diprion similis TaxID=362088 RepID=UPI001EF904E3|nr:uncharacterized protein K02A2.6-like [Diprion similis]